MVSGMARWFRVHKNVSRNGVGTVRNGFHGSKPIPRYHKNGLGMVSCVGMVLMAVGMKKTIPRPFLWF